jgi:hypothetical protein
MNWFNLVGMFNDEERMLDTGHLVINNYEMYLNGIIEPNNSDFSDPSIYVENGFNVWGYDSLRYPLMNNIAGSSSNYFFFNRSGMSFNREDWLEYTLRNLNENRNEDQALTLDSEVPFFYDHVPSTVIAEITDN